MTSLLARLSGDTRNQLFSCWCIPIYVVLFSIGIFLLAGFIPPPSPALGATEVAALFSEHSIRIRLGLFVSMYGTLFLMPMCSALVAQMKRVEGPGKVWTNVMLMNGAVNVLGFTIPFMFWQAAAFRPDRAPELVVLLNDMGWLVFVGMGVPFIAMPIAFGMLIVQDRSADPVFPRWVGWYSLAASTLLFPGGILVMFHRGHFAWDGLLGFWVAVIDFFVWFWVLFFVLRRAVLRETRGMAVAEGEV